MSQLTSKFDLISEESFASPMAMAITLAVSPTYSESYSSTPGANTTFPAGTIVEMDSTGKAIVAGDNAQFTQGGTSPFAVTAVAPKLYAVVIDGSDTFTGSFTGKLTCLIGGFQMITEQVTGTSFTVGAPVAVGAKGGVSGSADGKLRAWAASDQVFGYVGPKGYSVADRTLHVIVPHK
jgi:hypothetical protein